MNIDEYAEKIVNDFIHDITDHVFLNIQHNDLLMREYQTQVNRASLDLVNMAIGRKIKEILNLENDGQNDQPKSSLIKYYTYHKTR